MSGKFKRNFGDEEKETAALSAAGEFCPVCGKRGFAALRVMVTPPGGGIPFTVCFKKQCVFCGKIAVWRGKAKDGTETSFPAFYMPFSTRPGFSVKYRDFYFPPELYQTEDGKADVGLKARLAAAVVRLAEREMRRNCFSWEEVRGELDKNIV